MRGDQTAAWQGLTALAKDFSGFDLRDAFASDAQRAAHFSQEAPGVFADLSKTIGMRALKRNCWTWRRKRVCWRVAIACLQVRPLTPQKTAQ